MRCAGCSGNSPGRLKPSLLLVLLVLLVLLLLAFLVTHLPHKV